MDVPSDGRKVARQGRTFQIGWNGLPEDRAWDDFVVSLPGAHHEQTSLWGSVRASIGWSVARLVVEERGAIIAGAQVQLRSIGRLGRWAYITFGPCIAGGDPLVGELVMAELKHFLRPQGALYLLAQLPYDSHRLAGTLQQSGFIRPPRALAPFYMQATLVLDLAKEEERLLAEMRPNTRNHVRQGLKRGVTVVQGNEQDLQVFWELMRQLCARRKTTPNPSHPDFFRLLWKQLSPRGWVSLFLATHEGKPLSAALAFPFGKWFRVWKVGWSGDHGELRPNRVMWWEMIRHARRNGYQHFDFVSIDLAQPGLSSATNLREPSSDGATSFKLGFGGAVRMLPGAYCYFIPPLVRAAMRLGLVRLLNSRACINLARNVWRRGSASRAPTDASG